MGKGKRGDALATLVFYSYVIDRKKGKKVLVMRVYYRALLDIFVYCVVNLVEFFNLMLYIQRHF